MPSARRSSGCVHPGGLLWRLSAGYRATRSPLVCPRSPRRSNIIPNRGLGCGRSSILPALLWRWSFFWGCALCATTSVPRIRCDKHTDDRPNPRRGPRWTGGRPEAGKKMGRARRDARQDQLKSGLGSTTLGRDSSEFAPNWRLLWSLSAGCRSIVTCIGFRGRSSRTQPPCRLTSGQLRPRPGRLGPNLAEGVPNSPPPSAPPPRKSPPAHAELSRQSFSQRVGGQLQCRADVRATRNAWIEPHTSAPFLCGEGGAPARRAHRFGLAQGRPQWRSAWSTSRRSGPSP